MTDEQAPQTLEEVLQDINLLREFRHFLKKRLALENLMFIESIQKYEEIIDADQQDRIKTGEFMVKQFVDEESPDAVNLSHEVRDDLLRTGEFLSTTFDEARKEVSQLIHWNFMSDFQKFLITGEDKTGFAFVRHNSHSPSTYNLDLSTDNLWDFIETDSDGNMSIAKCKCSSRTLKKNKSNGKLYCCENSRVSHKVEKLKAKKTFSRNIRRTGSMLIRAVGSMTRRGSQLLHSSEKNKDTSKDNSSFLSKFEL